MKGKKFAEVFASLVKTVAIASVSESSDWYNYQTKEPEEIFVEKRTLQEEITMKNKLKKALCLGLVLTMFSTTAVMASTKSYSFGLMPENVDHTEAVQKSGSSAYAAVDVQYMNYPSATIKYQTQVADKGFTSAYTSKIGLGSIRVIYNQRVTSDDKVSLYAYNPSSNGVVTVSVKGNFTP